MSLTKWYVTMEENSAEPPRRRYWKKILQNLIDISLLKACILYNMNVREMPRSRFIISVLEAFCSPLANTAPQHQSTCSFPLSSVA